MLMCHNRYRVAGGEDRATELEAALLEEAGVEVERYELENAAIPENPGLSVGLRTLWSGESYKEVRRRIRAGRHHVIHVQNFFPLLSPSVFWAARREGVPVVVTLHNFRLACLNGVFFRDGGICEDCLGRPPYLGVWRRCYRGSVGASAAAASMLVVHRALGTWWRAVDIFITPSGFAKSKLAGAGLDASRIWVKPNFVHPDPGPGSGSGGFVLYVGRLSPEKGIRTLLRAWEMLQDGPDLVVAGEGPLEGEVRTAAAKSSRVSFVGRCGPQDVLRLMGEAGLVVVPSQWYEVFGRVVVEAFSVGTPVLASEVGALAEMVVPGHNGVLVAPGDAEALARTVQELWAEPGRLRAMREGARRSYEASYTGERNLELLEEIYRYAMARGKKE